MKKYNKQLKKNIQEIRASVQAHHTETDRQIEKYARQYEAKAARLKPEAHKYEDLADRAITQGNIEFSASQAELQINLIFEEIQKAVAEWIAEPPSAEFTAVMSTVDRFDLKLSRSEIAMLSPLASGSYIGQRVLDTFASANGMTTDFQSAEKLEQLINAARSDALLAVRAYCGLEQGYEWVTDKRYPIFRRVYALDYLNMDQNSLTDLQAALKTAMDPAISLLPSERERIGKYFDGYTDEDKVQRMVELITADPDHADRYALYDADVYKAARAEIREKKIAEDQAARQALRDAADASVKAHTAAAKASLEE